MVAISIGFTMLLFGLGILALLFASVKSLMQGKQDLKKIAVMAIPFVLFGISFAVFGDLTKAGVLTTAIMLAAMVLMIGYTGLRGTFK